MTTYLIRSDCVSKKKKKRSDTPTHSILIAPLTEVLLQAS